ncbi:unnamed protein product [Lactuca saligna]|uniref:Protochlorophyllide reductase n=1 Tax=Lactuca saligna TaxID=75948 RepID=A0AA35Z6I3_LACSI|nr:unnamed protein product [Lactuca saligna]
MVKCFFFIDFYPSLTNDCTSPLRLLLSICCSLELIKMMPFKELVEALRFGCTSSFWRMTLHWTYSLVFSYINLLTQTMFTQKSVYHQCVVSPLPPITSDKRLPICIITGATSGLGAAAALALSKKGFYVVLAGRSSHKLSKVMSDIRSQSEEEVQLKAFEVDTSSFSSIMRFKESLEQWLLESDMHPSIQLLINNAGIYALTSRLTTEGHHDQMMGTNYIGPFSLTQVLLPFLKNSPVPSRVINITSFTHRNVSSFQADKETVSGKCLSKFKHYPCAEIYEYSKLCMLLFSYELHRQLQGSGSQGVSVIGVDPGLVKTNIMREVPWCIRQLAFIVLQFLGFLQSPELGVSAVIDAALAPPETSGLYFFGGNGRTVESSALSYNMKLSRELWETSCDIFQDSLLNYSKVSVSSEKVD